MRRVSPSAGRAWKIGLSIGLAALLLYLFLRHLDLAAVGGALRSADRGWLATALLVSLVAIPLRSYRWTILLRPAGPVPQMESLGATCIGFAATTLLPARAGEIVRPAVLARRLRIPFTPALASIGLERLIDLLCVLALFVAFVAGGYSPAGLASDEAGRLALLRRSAWIVGSGTLAAFAVLTALGLRPGLSEPFLRVVRRLVPHRFADRVVDVLRSFLSGLSAVRTAPDAALVALTSGSMWLVNAFVLHAVLRAFAIQLPYPVSFFVLTWAVLGLAIPTPGGVGGYHTAFAYALTGFFAVKAETAAAAALVAHAISFVPITLFGILFLAASGLSLRGLAGAGPAPASSSPEAPARSTLSP